MIIYVHLRSTFAVKTLKNTCKSTAMDSISMIPGISTCFHSIQSTSQPSENYRGKILLSADAVGFGRATCRATWFPTVLQRSQVMSYPGKPPPQKKKNIQRMRFGREWSVMVNCIISKKKMVCNLHILKSMPYMHIPGTQTKSCCWLNMVVSYIVFS